MEVIRGTKGTANILQEQRIIDMSHEITLLEERNLAPLTVILKNISKERTGNPKFEWIEDTLGVEWDRITVAAGPTVTTLNVANAKYFDVNDLIKVPRTQEQMLIVGVDVNANTITVKRGWGTTAAAALVLNDPILLIGNAYEEGAAAISARSTKKEARFNYCEIFRHPFEVTGTLNASDLYGGDEFANEGYKTAVEHLKAIEKALIFGEPHQDLSGPQPRRSTAGVLHYIKTNRVDAGGTLTETEFNEFCRIAFKYGSKVKVFFCSSLILSIINGWSLNKLQITIGEDTYGLAIINYVTPHGRLKLIEHPLLEGTVYGGYGICLDIVDLKYRFMDGRDTLLRPGIQAPGEDKIKSEYLTEAGLELRHEKRHAVLMGVTG